MRPSSAAARLALRYFTGHGPATERDLAYWATLTLGDVRRGLEQVKDQLAGFDHDGRTFWHEPGVEPPRQPQHPDGHLLQILDETYRGYQDSRMVLDSEGLVPRGRETAIGKVASAAPESLAGRKVLKRDDLDGYRFEFDGGWLVVRPSGTEPLLRIYTEVTDKALVQPILEAGRQQASTGRRQLSAAARKRIAAAQKKRWAAYRKSAKG